MVLTAAEEHLQEKLFGSKEPVSTTLLSFELGQTPTEAADILQSFYQSHSDVLDASYKVKFQKDSKTCIKIVNVNDLDQSMLDTSRIWIVSSQNAADRAIIATVSEKAQKLQAGLSIGRLKHIGFVTNPLLENEFTISNGAAFNSSHRTVSPTINETKPKAESKSIEKSDSKQPLKAPNNPSKEKPSAPQKPISGQKSDVPSVPPKKSKTAPSFFTKASKDDALKSMRARRPDSKPVHEALVISDEVKDQDLEEIETEPLNKASKEDQLRELRESMLNEEGSDQEMLDQNDDELGDYDAAFADEDNMEVENESNVNAPDASSEAKPNSRDSSKSAELSGEGGQNFNEISGQCQSDAPKYLQPQTRRVRRDVVRKDEDGFDIHEEIWVDVPMESVGENSTSTESTKTYLPGTSGPKEKVASEKEPLKKKEAKTEPDGDAKRVAKAPPKVPMGQKKQKTLMSFFGKK